MIEEKKLSIDFAQFLLGCVAEDLKATKELLGPGSPLSGTASSDAAKLLKAIADGLENTAIINDPLIYAAASRLEGGVPTGEARGASGAQLVFCVRWPL